MAHKELTYRSFDIEYDDDTAEHVEEEYPQGAPIKELTIAGKEIEAHATSGQFGSRYMPYTLYDSVEALAKAIVDDSPDFDTTSDK